MREALVFRIPAAGPDDVSELQHLVEAGALDPAGIVAILGKTEGNGCVNDFSRGYAAQSLLLWLRRHLDAPAASAVCLVMSGGTEGAMSPHWTVFARRDATSPGTTPALAVGRAHTPPLPPEQLGRAGQAALVAQGVRDAMQDAGIADAADIHFVQVKCPLLTAARIAAARGRGAEPATTDTLKSMGLSRGASALGVGLALGELDHVEDTTICRDWSQACSRASCSAGIELLGHEVVVLGMSRAWCGPLAIDHAVMADAIDIEPVRAALARLGLATAGQLKPADRPRLAALLAKAEASPDGLLRGARHTMLDDSDIVATRHARGFVAGALAGLIGHAELYVSGGAEHQGPPGGGPVAAIARRSLAE